MEYSISDIIKKRWSVRLYFCLIKGFESYLFPLFLLALRVSMAEIFWHMSMAKLNVWTSAFLLSPFAYKIPILPHTFSSTMAVCVELAGVVLLSVGFGTRLVVLPLISLAAIVQLSHLQYAVQFGWISSLILLLLVGPGKISIDALVRYWLGRTGCLS